MAAHTLGLIVNAALRAAMTVMLASVLRAGRTDPRYAGKGIGVRFAAAGLPASLLVPVTHTWRRRARGRDAAEMATRTPYPAWMDNLWLSMLALDLAGNVFDLYDRHDHFDLIPHAHGTGVVTVTAAWLLRLPMAGAVAAATAGHVLLEAQEIASDRLFGFRNVRGAWDTAGDLAAGIVGALVYAAAYQRLVRDAGREPPSPLAGSVS